MARTRKRTKRRGRTAARRTTAATRATTGRRLDVDSALRNVLNELRAERDQLDRRIAAIEAALSPSAGRAATSTASAGARSAALPPGRKRMGHGYGGYRKGSVKEYILRVLEKASGPMQVKDIAAAVVRAGYKTRNQTLAKSVGLALASMPEVEKVGRGAYQLRR